MKGHELQFERSAYTADAIQRAAYRMSDKLSIDLISADAKYRCLIHIRPDGGDASAVLHEFRNCVLDEALRERIRHETEGVRNVILSLAFSRSGLSASE